MRARPHANMGPFFFFFFFFFSHFSLINEALYLPGSYPHKYSNGDFMWVKVNSITSVETEMPFGYYTLPFCKPQEGIKDSRENLGEILMGDRIENSPYRFRTNVNESDIFLCSTGPLSPDQARILKQRIDEVYQVNPILDNLPAIRYTLKDGFTLRWTGYPVGVHYQDRHYIFNHLKFKVSIHKYDDEESISSGTTTTGSYIIVGFQVVPCSYNHDHTKEGQVAAGYYDKLTAAIECDPATLGMAVTEGEPVAFTYEVSFVESELEWPSRWDAYLKMEGARVHWFSIFNSLTLVTFLAGIVFVILLRTVRQDLTRYDLNILPHDDDHEQQQLHEVEEELSGWKMLVGDVFRAPSNPELLCVLVGDGVQILGMGFVTIFFAAFGFMSPASRGRLITGMIFFYPVLGVAAGYVGARLWRSINDGGKAKGWVSVSWMVACFFAGIAFADLTLLNILLWFSGSTGAIPLFLYATLLFLWFSISLPLTLFGGFAGANAPPIDFPVRTCPSRNIIAREIPRQKYPSWLLVLASGSLPFGTLFIELFFIMSSLWLGQVYYVFGFLLIVLVLFVVVSAEVSIVLTYMHLCAEDWQWWWKSFFSSGSVALYIFLYSISYLIFDLRSLSGPVSVALYLGYSFLIAFAIMLAAGTVGFLASFWFVHFLFSSVKLD